MITGLRMNNAYIRPGGVAQDLPPGAIDKIRDIVPPLRRGLHELELLLIENPILKGRTVDVGYLDLTGCMALGHHRPGPALDRPAARPAQARAVLRLRDLRLRGHRRATPATPTAGCGSASTRCTSR